MKKRSNIKELSIPKPCHQNWSEMQGEGSSRHCANCEKPVHNLAGLSNEEVIQFISGKKGRPTCAKFTEGQLDHINDSLDSEQGTSVIKPLILAAAMTTAMSCGSINKIEEPHRQYNSLGYEIISRSSNPDSIETTIVKGIMIDEYGAPVQGSAIVFGNAARGCMSDSEGKFVLELDKPAMSEGFIKVSTLGYEGGEIELSEVSNSDIKIVLIDAELIMGEVCVVHQPVHKRLWNRLKNIF